MKKFEIEGHEPSYLPEEGQWELVWADEFDGTELDRTKWDFRLNFWGKPFEAYTDQGVILDGNSHLELHRVEKDGHYVSAQLQTGSNSFDPPKDSDRFWPLGTIKEPTFQHRYGYYECRCKFQKEPDVMWSAFWLQAPTIGTNYDPKWCGVECDIMEYFAEGENTSGNIYGGYGHQCKEDGRIKYKLEDTPDGWHYFGLDWQEDGYVYYCDGKEMARCNKAVSAVPQFILLTTEIRGYRFDKPLKVGEYMEDGKTPKKRYDGFVDDAFIVDFVRVYDRVKRG